MKCTHGMSALTLGTAGLAQPYAGQSPPSRRDAMALLCEAVRLGVTVFDTAPTYGTEELVGQAVGKWHQCLVATKIAPRGLTAGDVRRRIDASRRAVQRDVLDIVQLHNPTTDDFFGVVFDQLLEEQTRSIRWIGASVYTESEALAAIASGVHVLQVPYNLLDQRFAGQVFEEAQARDVRVLTRSPWLRGLLTTAAGVVAASPSAYTAADAARSLMMAEWDELPHYALRFCLTHQAVTSVIAGPRSLPELHAAVTAAERGRLGVVRRTLAKFAATARLDVIDPRVWDRVGPEEAA